MTMENSSAVVRILFLGDIIGRAGRAYVIEQLPIIKQQFQLDLVIANAENAAGSRASGITGEIAKELHEAGVQAITLGNHTWGQKEFVHEIDALPFVCRPVNFFGVPGASFVKIPFKGKIFGIAALMGQEFMKIRVDSPFRAVMALIKEDLGVDAWIVDMHAETTAEKMALGWYLNGSVLAVLGTHTHVQTNDAQVLDGGTAYMTDLGMCGPYRSIIGQKIEFVLQRFLGNMPWDIEVATEDLKLRGCLIEVDLSTLKARSAKAFQWPLEETH